MSSDANRLAPRLIPDPLRADADPSPSNRPIEELAELAAGAPDPAAQREAFDELFRRLWRATVDWSCSAGAAGFDRAEDAATQAWFRAWRYRAKFDPAKGSYCSWLRRIVRNETYGLLGAGDKEVSVEDVCSLAAGRSPVEPLPSDSEGLDLLVGAFNELSLRKPEFARVLSLKVEGYRERQIGEMLGIPHMGTVASRLFRAREFVGRYLADRGVVFLPEGAIGTIHPLGLAPLCRAGDGRFYRFSPLSGLFVLPCNAGQPPHSEAVCSGFFVKVWSYPLDRFEISVGDHSPAQGAVFRWKQYVVHALGE